MSFVSSKGNILCRLIKIELYKIFAIINRAINGLHCIMPLGWISAIPCNWLRWSNWDRTADLTLPCVCSATKMPKIKHPYQLHPYKMSGNCPESNQLHFIIIRKVIFIYINVISGKTYLKSKLQRYLYVIFYQSYEDLWTGSTQQGGLVGPCPTPAGSSTAWPVMHETATRQL